MVNSYLFKVNDRLLIGLEVLLAMKRSKNIKKSVIWIDDDL